MPYYEEQWKRIEGAMKEAAEEETVQERKERMLVRWRMRTKYSWKNIAIRKMLEKVLGQTQEIPWIKNRSK